MRRALCCGLVGVWLGFASAAHAQTGAAEALFEEGRKALAAGDLALACARFRASDQMDPGVGTRANLGDCEERRGRIASAWEAYRGALAKMAEDDRRRSILKQHIRELEARLPKLVLTLSSGAPANTTVKEDEVTVGASATWGVALPLDPGVHHLVVAAPEREPRTVDVTLAEGKTVTLTVEPGEAQKVVAPTPVNPERRSKGPWIVGGAGVGLLVVGAVTGALVLQQKGVFDANCHHDPVECNAVGGAAGSKVTTLGPVTTAALVAGMAGVAAGGIWLGLQARSARVGLAPTSAGVVWRVEAAW